MKVRQGPHPLPANPEQPPMLPASGNEKIAHPVPPCQNWRKCSRPEQALAARAWAIGLTKSVTWAIFVTAERKARKTTGGFSGARFLE